MLLDSNFSFFVYTVPQNILFCFSLYLLFHLTKQYRISKCVRRFYFIKTVFAIAMLEENLGYFVFVCFSHLGHSFSFKFADKVSILLSVFLLFCLVVFALCFYLLVAKYLRKKAVYFTEVTYRESAGFCYKALMLSTQSVLRAAIFYFFTYQYAHKLFALCFVEFLALTFTITL